MKQFFRNIKGSKFWERTLAIVMVCAVVVTLLPANLQLAWSADGSDLLGTDTSVGLLSVNLGASYKTEDGKTVAVELNQNDTFELPYDADITMRLDFMLQDGNSVNGNTTYTYKLPDSVRVDVDATHDLSWQGGTPIGKVHIKKDGTLDFTFDESVLQNQNNVPFYVQFEGNFSSENQQEGKKIDITFPASDGGFTFHVETLPASKEEEDIKTKDIGISKSGNVITGEDGKRYIEWNVSLSPNGRDSIDGNIVDHLPAGLTYVEGNGYPRIQENAWGGNYGTVSATTSGNDVIFHLSGTGSNSINVKFLTSYDVSAFGSTVNQSEQIGNSVIFNPDNTVDKSVTADGNVWIYPNMVSKSSATGKLQLDETRSQYYVDWTVRLNTEQLNIAGGTYTDEMSTGLIPPSAGGISVAPNVGTVTTNSNGFQIEFNSPNPITDPITVTYRTYVDNAELPLGQFTNKAEFEKTGFDKFSQTATVNGVDYLKKNIGYNDYDKITQTFRWTITVNQEKADLENVVVTDTFLSNEMEYVSSNVPLADTSDKDNGTLVFKLGNLNGETRTIQVVTRIKPGFDWQGWHNFVNNVKMTADNIPEFNHSASYNVDKSWEIPDFIHKDGTMNGDGTITWTVRVDHVSADVKGMHFTDILPADMEYVPGSFYLREYWWDGNQGYRNPVVTTLSATQQQLSYDLSQTTDEAYIKKEDGYAITYKTRSTDPDKAMASGTYTNQAKMVLDFPGDIQIEDEVTKTVSGRPGGVVEKTYDYNGGREVLWHVKINEARMNLNIDEPVLEDTLPDYMDYVSGKLYLLAEDGTRSEVPKSEYQLTAINGDLRVKLPKITNQCYEFEFITSFNPLYATALEGKIINNTIRLTGKGSGWQDTSGTIQNVEYSSSSAGAVLHLEIRIKKVDEDDETKVLSGATFQLKLGDTVVGTATSGQDGYAVFKNLSIDNYGYAFDVVEITAPSGYNKKAGLDSIQFLEGNLQTDSLGTRYIEVVIGNESANKQTTGSVAIVKTDAADATKKLSGAVFGIYSDSACTSQIATMTTGANGVAEYSGLAPNTYYIKEITSPEGYKADASPVITATLTQNGAKVDTAYTGAGSYDSNRPVISNTRIKASLTIHKTNDASPAVGLQGAVIGLYTDPICEDRIEQKTTDANGIVVFDDLVPGRTYYYREDTAPAGYVQNTEIYAVKMGEGTERIDIEREGTIVNQSATGNVVVTKYGDDGKLLAGVVFNLSGTSSAGGTVNETATTDADGVARFENIPFGTYTLSETSGLDNYIVAADKTVIVNQLGDTDVTVVNQLKRMDLRLTKVDAADSTILLANAQFGLYTSNGVRIATGWTDRNGFLEFKDVVYGDYYVEEITPPAGYKLNTNRWTIAHGSFDTAITADPQDPHLDTTINNTRQDGSIRLQKEDTNGVALAGAEFTLYNDMGQPYTGSRTTNPAISAADGSILFEHLPWGTYYIQETKAPDTYLRDDGYYRVEVRDDTTVTEYYDGDDLKTDAFQNIKMNPPYVSFKLKKVDGNGTALPGAIFGFYLDDANQTLIATAVTDEEGIAYFRRIHVDADNIPNDSRFIVKETKAPAGYTLDDKNITYVSKEAMGSFADGNPDNPPGPGNVILDDDDILYVDGSISVSADSTFRNEGITGSILVTKHGVTDLESLAGAEFTLYDTDGNKITRDAKGTAITNPVTTGRNGTARFNNLPYGRYILQETKPPMGYALNQNPISVEITTQGQVVTTGMRDNRLDVRVSKREVGGILEIEGAELQIKKADGTVIESWTTGTEAHRVTYNKLEAGQEYILSEATAPKGYAYTGDVRFKIEENGSVSLVSSNGEVQAGTVIMRDAPFALSVSKEDETGHAMPNAILALYDEDNKELERWTTNGEVHALNCKNLAAPKTGYNYYVLKELSAPIGYEIAENMIIALDSAGNFYSVDAIGATPTVGAIQNITMVDVEKPAGVLYARKIDAGTGISLPGSEFAILTYNTRTNQPEQALGTATGSLLYLDSAGLKNHGFQWTSTDVPHRFNLYDDQGRLLFGVDNPNSCYALVEVRAPEGYTIAEPVVFRLITDTNTNRIKIEYISGAANGVNIAGDTFRVEDAGLSLTIRKQNEFGLCLAGAKLKLSEYDTTANAIGSEVITFVSENSPKVVDPTLLKPDQSYILQEIEVPEGYGKAEDIIFTIHQDASITIGDRVVDANTIVMEDYSSGVVINKLTEEQSFLPGVTLELSSKDDPTFTTKQWVTGEASKIWDMFYFKPGCTYTLTEAAAPDGYAYAKDISFRISDDGTAVIIDGEQQNTRILNMIDRRLELHVNKLDSVDGVPVSGATLEIRDTSGNVVAGPWVTGTDQEIDISRLTAGNGYRKDVETNPDALREYVLHETLAPESHKYALDIHFAIDRDGTIYYVKTGLFGGTVYEEAKDHTVVMYDDPKLVVDKRDENGAPVAGATFMITSNADPTFEPMMINSTPYYIQPGTLKPNVTYTLTEVSAPKGYTYAKSYDFTIDEAECVWIDGKKADNKLFMVDETIKVRISKQDITNKEELPGAKLEIRDETGTVIYEFTSGTEPTLIPFDVFTAPTPGNLAYYSLTEITAPDGYEVAETIYFALDSEGRVYIRNTMNEYVLQDSNTIVMLDQPTNVATDKTPKTGDSIPLKLMILLGLISLFVGCILLQRSIYGRKG